MVLDYNKMPEPAVIERAQIFIELAEKELKNKEAENG